MSKLCQLSYSDAIEDSQLRALAGAIYDDDDKSITIVSKCKDSPEQYHVIVANNSRYVCFVFRGTDSVADSITDANILRVRHPQGEGFVHAGFFSLWTEIEREILEYTERYKDFNVITTGHSLGGAMAVLAALAIRRQRQQHGGEKSVSVYTFGCPKIGCSIFSAHVNDVINCHHFVRSADIVPRLPLGPRFSAFAGNTTTVLDLWFGFYHPRLFCTTRDHSIAKYVKAMEKSSEYCKVFKRNEFPSEREKRYSSKCHDML